MPASRTLCLRLRRIEHRDGVAVGHADDAPEQRLGARNTAKDQQNARHDGTPDRRSAPQCVDGRVGAISLRSRTFPRSTEAGHARTHSAVSAKTLVINDDIRITVPVDIRTSQIKLAIEAPDDARIYREELWLRLRENPQ